MTELLLYPLNENRFQLDFKGFFNTKKKNPAKQHLAYLDNVNKFIKLNYNCPDSEKQGTGPGSCGGSKPNNDKKELQPLNTKTETFNNFKYEMDAFFKIPAQIADSKLIQYNQNISKHPENIRLEGMRLIHRTGSNNYQKEAREQIISEITNNTQLGKYLNDKIIAETKAFEENPVRLYRSGKYKNSIIESFTSNPDSAFTTNFDDVPPGNDFHKDYDELKTDGWKVLSGVLQDARYPEEYEVTLINIDELNKYRNKQKQNSAYLEDVSDFIKLNYKCKAGTVDDSNKCEPDSDSESSGNEHKNITMFPRSSNNKYENGLEFYARLWKVDPEIYDMIKEKVEGSPEYNLFNKLGDKWLRNVDPEAREDAISVVQNNKLLKSYLLHEQFGLDVPEKTTLYRVGRAKTGMTNSFFPNKQVAEAYQKRMGVESIYEYEVPTNEVIPSLSGAGEIWVPGDVESIIEKQNATYLADAFETIKLNYKCPKGTVDDSNKCNTENESLKNDDITVSNKNPIIIEKLTDEVIAALRYYTDEGYRNINHSLRHDGGESMTPEATEHMEWIDAMFEDKRAILTEGVVYRGYNSFELSQDDVVGSTIKDPAFVSVSNNESNANIFIDTAKFPVMAEIHIPDGSRGLAIPDSIATLPVGESEILLPRDSKFKITKSENKNGIKYITMDLITDRPIKTKQNSAYLDEVAEFIKLNYKCPTGTVDETNACKPTAEQTNELKNLRLDVNPKNKEHKKPRSTTPDRFFETNLSTNINQELSSSITSVIKNAYKNIPELNGVPLKVVNVNEKENRDLENAYAAHDMNKIYLNDKYFSDINEMQEKLTKEVESGFHPKGCNTAESIITHELGHLLFNGMALRGDEKWDNISELFRKLKTPGNLLKLADMH